MRRFVPRAMLAALVAASATACAAGGAAGVDPNTDFGSRTLVMVPDLQGPRGAQVANELRRLITESTTHAAMNAEAIEAGMTRYQLTPETFDEVRARQLAPLIRANLLSWGSVAQEGQTLRADIKFIDPRTQEEIEADATGATAVELAANIYQNFTRATQAMTQVTACTDQLAQQQWQAALTACDAVLAVIPTNSTALLGRGLALTNLDRHEEALAAYNRILATDPTNADALIGAGKAASELGQSQQAVAFYNRYIDINAATIENRMAVANTAVQLGDFASAFALLEPAAAENRTNAEFQRFLFNVAAGAGQADSTQAARFYGAALTAFPLAYPAGSELDFRALNTAVAVALQLDRSSDAVQLAQIGTQRLADNADAWLLYATALRTAGRVPEALEALGRVVQINPNTQGVYLTRAQIYLEQGQRDLALADFERAAQMGNAGPVSQILFNQGAQAFQAQNYDEAATAMTLAHRFGTGQIKDQAAFYLGYAKLQQAVAIAQGNAQAQRAAVARNAITLLEEARTLLGETTVSQAAQLLPAIENLLNNQNAVVRQGR